MNAIVKYKTISYKEMEVNLVLTQDEALYLKNNLLRSDREVATDIWNKLPSLEVLNECLNK